MVARPGCGHAQPDDAHGCPGTDISTHVRRLLQGNPTSNAERLSAMLEAQGVARCPQDRSRLYHAPVRARDTLSQS